VADSAPGLHFVATCDNVYAPSSVLYSCVTPYCLAAAEALRD